MLPAKISQNGPVALEKKLFESFFFYKKGITTILNLGSYPF